MWECFVGMSATERDYLKNLLPAGSGSKLLNLNIFELPNLAIIKILDYLSFQDLKNLRIVCQSAKCWVEQPRYLRKLQLYIKNESVLNEIVTKVNSNSECRAVGWVNVIIPTELLADALSLHLRRVFKANNAHLKIVKIGFKGETRTWSQNLTSQLIDNVLCELGCQVECLELYGKFLFYTSNATGIFNAEEYANVVKTQNKMRELCFPAVRKLEYSMPMSVSSANSQNQISELDENLHSFIEALLGMLPNLTTMKLPIRAWPSTSNETQNTLCSQLDPIIAYLRKLQSTSSATSMQQQPALELHFDSRVSFNKIFIDCSTLLELAAVCFPLNGSLFNVPDIALPTTAVVQRMTPFALASLNACVKSVLCGPLLTEIGSGSIFIPEGANLLISSTSKLTPIVRQNLPTFVWPNSLNITAIELDSPKMYWWFTVGDQNFSRQLFQVVRPTVTTLKLVTYTKALLPVHDFSYCFPNLRQISLDQHFESDTTHTEAVLGNLPSSMQRVHLRRCRLSENCFLGNRLGGPDIPMHLKYPNLTHLTLVDCDLNELSPATFKEVIKNMSLKELRLVPNHPDCQITFKKELLPLANANGALKGSLQAFDCFIPYDSNAQKMKAFLTKFRNLKSSSIRAWVMTPEEDSSPSREFNRKYPYLKLV